MKNTCDISPNACVDDTVKFGFGVRVYANAEIKGNCDIGDYSVIGYPTKNPTWAGRKVVIPEGSVIRSHTVIYEGSSFVSSLETGHHVVIREGTRAGENLRVGNYSDVEGDCVIGDFCRFHGYVHVGKGSKIGNFVWLYSLVTLTNDPLPPSNICVGVEIADGVVVCVNCMIMPGSKLGEGAFVSAGSQVQGVVPSGAVHHQGKILCGVSLLRSIEHKIDHPWMNHFKADYPESAWPQLDDLLKRIKSASATIKPK